MKSRILLITLCSLGAPFALSAQQAAPADAGHAEHAHGEHGHGGQKGDSDHEHTELGERMEKIGKAFRALSRQVNDASKNEASLQQVATIRAQAEEASKFEPAKTADLPADKRTEFVAAYRKQMQEFLGMIDKLEAALKGGDNAEAANIVKAMKKDMEDAHGQFRKKKERKG